jgi:hypothetical protein
MTIRQYFEKYMYERGMSQESAAECVKFAETHPSMAPIAGRWDEPTDGYPSQLLAALTCGMDDIALEWIDKEHEFEVEMRLVPENTPPPWYRPVFDRQVQEV